jgi:restriction system protein
MDHSELILTKLFPEGSHNPQITAVEFEKLIYEYLTALGSELKSFSAQHDVLVSPNDGDYQIDMFAEFEALGARIKVLVECKRHKNSIKRETVQVLHSKIISTGSNKGIIFTTSGYQSGAIEYAEKHGIALIAVRNGRMTSQTKSGDRESIDARRLEALNKVLDEFGEPKYQCVYMRGKTLSVLRPDFLEPLKQFVFE